MKNARKLLGARGDRMLTILRDVLRNPTTPARLNGNSNLPVQRAEISPRFRTRLLLPLFTIVFVCSGTDFALAMNVYSGNASAISAKAIEQTRSVAVTTEPEEHGPSQKAVEIARPFGFPITNSMAASWIVAVGLILFAQVATRHMKPVPEGVQNFWEWMVEGLYTFLQGIIGPHLVVDRALGRVEGAAQAGVK